MKQLAVYNWSFGRVRVVERRRDGARSYLTGGSLQTLVDASGASLFGYVNALKILLKDRQKILMVGGAGDSLATMLALKGHHITVVDIDPLAERVARRFFRLDSRIEWVTADGLTFQGNSRNA